MDWLAELDPHWVWLTVGLVLAGLEMLVPGVYLIWLAVAAIITGLLTAAFDLSVSMQLADFVSLSLIIAFSARRFLRDKPIESSDPLMNRRGARMVGETALVVSAIEHGSGRIKVGDSEWIAKGANTAAGDRVRIVGVEGSSLLVEPVVARTEGEALPPAEA